MEVWTIRTQSYIKSNKVLGRSLLAEIAMLSLLLDRFIPFIYRFIPFLVAFKISVILFSDAPASLVLMIVSHSLTD